MVVELALVFAAEPSAEQMCSVLLYETPGYDNEAQVGSAPLDLCESMPNGYADLWVALGPAD